MMIRNIRPLAMLALLGMAGTASAQTVNLTGRVLEKATMLPVAGATVKVNGSSLSTVTGADGRFSLKGSVTGLRARVSYAPDAPYVQGGELFVTALAAAQSVRVELCGLNGRTLSTTEYRAPNAGWNRLGLAAWPREDLLGFARITTAGVTYVQRVLHLSDQPRAQWTAAVSSPRTLSKVTASGQVNVTMDKLVPKTVAYAADSADLGDIVLDYPARVKIGVGATTPYGAIVLFDGSHGKTAANQEMQAKWKDWGRFTPGPIMFKIATDPEFPNDTNHATMQTCCPTAQSWGYDDIQSLEVHGDAQIHVEWNAMGKYDNGNIAGENPDTNSNCSENNNAQCFFNSGVYIQSRYEIQLQAFPLGVDINTAGSSHSLGSIVNEFTPTSNQNKLNGNWQSYDATFRTARYTGKNKTSDGYMSVWWNGVQTHLNRHVTGVASGLANHSGEEMNDTLYGLKLQNETGDVRFRNVWIKKLNIDSTGTNFGY